MAVYYVEQFYIGLGLAVKNNGQEAMVQYLDKTNGRKRLAGQSGRMLLTPVLNVCSGGTLSVFP